MPSPSKTYPPKAASWCSCAVGFLFAVTVVIIKYGGEILETLVSPGGVVVLCFGVWFSVYLDFFALRRWVHLHDNFLEIQTVFGKWCQDHLGIDGAGRAVIHYRQIRALRRMQGFGGFNLLCILLAEPGPGKRRGYNIPYHGVEGVMEIEAELLRRAPATCERYSVSFLGYRGPFR
jgi:hypothetical protein